MSLGHEQAFARDTFIGREAEIGLLRRALVDASGGRGRLVLLSGEPGIGKTRTCEELAAYAQAHRARVLWGRCYEGEGAPAFWPWVQILRSSPKTDANDLGLSLDAGGLDIAPIVAQVRQRHADPLGTVDDESPRARFRLFDSLARLFERIARASPPLLLIIDDLHGADRSSLLLLQFVAREMRAMPLLIVGAYRDVSLKADDALTETVVEALREPGTERLVLNGFSAAEIARCIEMSAGVRPAAALVAALHQQTGGNPLFVTELLRVFLAEHDLVAIRDGDAAVATSIPRTVKAVIGRRLAPLSTACNAVLATACVLGRDFRLDVLEQVASTQSAETLQALDEAVAARVLVRLRERVERYRFSHAVVRETLYENLSMAQRLRLHRRVADALEQLPDVEDHYAEIAFHFSAAGRDGDATKAAAYAQRAGDRARSVLAYEEAARLYQFGLRCLARMAVVPAGGQSEDVQRLRAALLATLAEARGRAGEAEAAQPVSAHEVQTEARDAFPPDSQSEDSGHRVPPDAPAQSGMVTSTAQTDQSAPGKVKRGHEVGTAARVFVGREAEMKMLRVTLDDVIDGHGCVVLVGGAPGVGKTALAEQLANHAAARRARVLWGRCTQDDGAPAFWPWVQVVRAYIHDWEPDELRALLGSRAPDIAVAVPDLEIWGSDPSARVTTEAEDARVRMFDGLAGFLRDGSQRQPLVVVLEDLQWADHTSLRFLQRLATEIRASRLLIVGTFRDLEAGHEQALSTTLAELSSSAAAKRLLLRGLSEPDVERFIARTASIVPPASLVSALWRESDGNPFFLGEIVRWLSEEGQLQGATEVSAWSFPIPQGVRAVIGSRLGKLSDDCNQVLALAAVIGQEFGLGLLQAVAAREMAPLPADRLLEVLDTAEAAQLVALRADNTEQYCFAHALIRETLYEELGAQRRVRLHRQVTAALEELHGSGSDSSLAALAHHALRGAHGGGDVDKAIDYASRAAAEASARLAFEAAVTHHRQALQALGLKTPAKADPARRCDLLLALALAHSSAGHVGRARTAMLDAVPFARQSGDARRLAKAVIGIWKIGMEVGTYGSLDEEALALVDEALQAIGSADEVLRVRLLIIRARIFNRALLPDLIERARPLCREAVAVARRVGDREALLEALSLLYLAIETPDNLPERRALIAECIDLAAANHDPNGLVVAYDYRVNFSLEVGDRAALDAAIAAVARIAQEVPRPLFRMYALAHQAVVAQAAGRSHDEERYADQLLALGRGAAGPIARVLYATRALMMRYEQGRLEDSEMIWRALVAQAPDVPTGRVILTWMLASTGRIEEARQEFERLAALDFTVAWDVSWLLNHALLAMVCDTLGDSARAVLLYGRLLPYAESCVWAGGPIWLGSVSLFLGLLARTQLRWEDAERHFEQAIEVNTRIGLRPWLARAQYEYAAMLLARQSADDRTTATALLRQALATAREISMTALLEQGLALKQRADLSEDGTADTPRPGVEDAVVQMPPSATPAVFRLAGDYWTIAYDGLVIRLRDTKGLQYLAHLLRHPGQELLAIDLVAGIAGDADRDQYVAVCADPLAAAMPDATARLQYKERMAELRDELAEAERNNDLGRAARAREEMEHIAEQLALACGLGGRRRVGGIAGERARQAVTKAIRSAIDKIGRSHPALARHLTRTVKTGYYCAYALDPESGVAWDL